MRGYQRSRRSNSGTKPGKIGVDATWAKPSARHHLERRRHAGNRFQKRPQHHITHRKGRRQDAVTRRAAGRYADGTGADLRRVAVSGSRWPAQPKGPAKDAEIAASTSATNRTIAASSKAGSLSRRPFGPSTTSTKTALFPDIPAENRGLPLEMTIRVFRTYKGDIEQVIHRQLGACGIRKRSWKARR